jgi:hypothetical protein
MGQRAAGEAGPDYQNSWQSQYLPIPFPGDDPSLRPDRWEGWPDSSRRIIEPGMRFSGTRLAVFLHTGIRLVRHWPVGPGATTLPFGVDEAVGRPRVLRRLGRTSLSRNQARAAGAQTVSSGQHARTTGHGLLWMTQPLIM